jgi:Probable Zinc-ribbon domain
MRARPHLRQGPARPGPEGVPRAGRFKSDPAAAREAAGRSQRPFPRVIRSLADSRPDLVAEWHPTRNVGLSPVAIGMTSTEPVWWCCSECGHEWRTSVDARRHKGRGQCPRCVRERQRTNSRLGELNARQQQARALANPICAMPQLVAEWHPTRNIGLDLTVLARGSHRRAWWQCGACGHEWEAKIYTRVLMGSGCPRCRGKRTFR